MSADACMAIEADFAWFSQRCLRPSVDTVTFDGEEWPVCADHLRSFKGADA